MSLSRALPLLALLAACGPDVVTDRTVPPALAAADPAGERVPPAGELQAADALDGGPPDAARPVSTAAASMVTSSGRIDPGEPLAAVLYSERDVEVRSRIDGVLEAVHVELGDRVAPGALLARMDDGEEAALLASAEAAAELARSRHGRSLELAEKEMITREELEEAVYRLRSTEAAVQDAGVRLSWTRVRAPFGGVVARRFVRPGEWVEEGQPLFRVTALSPLRALVRIPEARARQVSRGAVARLTGIDGTTVEGRVARIAPAVDPVAGTVEVLVDVGDPGPLRPGTTVTVEFQPTR